MISRDFKAIVATSDGAIARITLNRPERRNAIGMQMVNELLYALGDANDDADIRVIVLSGAGKAFCAGGDFSQMMGGAADELPPRGDYADLLRLMVDAPKPIIARVHGAAMGGGLGLAAACTFAVASSDASLGTPEINVGLFPMMIMAVLSRLMPRRRLLEMMLLGQRISAQEAADLGLVNKVVAPEQLDAAVEELTAALANKSPIAIRLGLGAFAAQQDLSLQEALPMLRERLSECLTTDDAAEGLAAFLEKRQPVWKGK